MKIYKIKKKNTNTAKGKERFFPCFFFFFPRKTAKHNKIISV